MSRFVFYWFLPLLFSFVAVSLLFAADNPAPWDALHFSVDPKALYQAASEPNPSDATDITVLHDEETYVFDANGRSVRTEYMIYKVLTKKGAEDWDSISMAWEPWHDERPTIKARVVTPDYSVHELDQKTVVDSPAKDDDSTTYSDNRIMRAPLPAIAPGSVVEEELVVKESAPFFGAGTVGRFFFGRIGVPVQHNRLVLDAPSALPIRYVVQVFPDLKPQRTEANGHTKIVFEYGAIASLDPVEENLPSDVPVFPAVAFSTGASWQQIAEEYSKIVDSHISGSSLKTLVDKLILGKRTQNEKAQAILEYLNKEVRYTGVELSEAAIIPHSPEETLSHKYGDCKDKATLLVAMLRTANIPAHVALLNAGARLDVPSDLPGMGLFDHAIVYVPGNPDLWIDATDEHARLDQLPNDDQGRLALVVRPDSNALIRTMEKTSQDNVALEMREIDLAENGPARIVETSQPVGYFESEYRGVYTDKQNKETHDNLNDYMKSQYLAEKLDRFDRSDPSDFSKPFVMVLESKKAKRGFTELDNAVAAIRLEGLFYNLPNELQKREDTEEDKGNLSKPKKKRTEDYQLHAPFVAEWRYKIVPPLGFQPEPLPPNAKLSLGPSMLTEQFSADKDGVVDAVIRFDTVKRRFTVAEATELRNKVAELRQAEAILINFEPLGRSLLKQGKVKEAVENYRALIAQHPKEAVHHLQIAKVLLEAGLGEGAREEARAAVKLEPNSALAQKTLAEILEYDLVGRKLRPGSDYAGAAEALKAAVKLDPEDKTTVGNLAILLEYNEYGARYGAGAKLKESVATYRTLTTEKLAEIGLQNNQSYALFYAGDFGEARKNAEPLNPQPKALMVACEAAAHGSQAGIAEANKRSNGETEFQQVVKSAGEMLMNIRMYSVAADLLQAGASGNNASNTLGLASMLRKARLHEQLQYPDDPAGLMMSFFLTSLDSNLTVEKLEALSSRNARLVVKNYDPEEIETTLKAGKQLRRKLARTGASPDVTIDILLQMIEPKVEGNDTTGYREKLQIPGGKKITIFVVKEEGKYKVLDTTEKPNAVALETLDRIATQNIEGARILLDWVRDEQHLEGGDDPFSGNAFPRFWTRGKNADAAQMKLAAAAMLAESKPTAKQGIFILEEAKKSASNDADKANIDLALLAGYSNVQDYARLLDVTRELAKMNPESKRVFYAESLALRALGKFDEADSLAQERLKLLPDDLDAMRALSGNAVVRGDYRASHDWNQKLVDAGKAEASDLNELAWYTLFWSRAEGPDTDAAMKAAQLNQSSTAILHTLGCIYAETGKTKEAYQVLVQSMDLLDLDEPNPDYWYAFGRIAEQYGENDVARADYARVPKPKQAFQIPGSTYFLAQNRLKVLGNLQQKAISAK